METTEQGLEHGRGMERAGAVTGRGDTSDQGTLAWRPEGSEGEPEDARGRVLWDAVVWLVQGEQGAVAGAEVTVGPPFSQKDRKAPEDAPQGSTTLSHSCC